MNRNKTKLALWLEWAFLLAVVALATYLRYWRIEEVPPGFNSDEAVGAMGALTTLREGFKYSYEGQGGGGALGFYFAAAAFYLFGPSIAAIRGLAAWAGVVSIFTNYWAVRELFRVTGLNRARWMAALSTLGLAVSWWHLSASRIAFAGIGVPFLMLPSVYFLWLGLNRFCSDTEKRRSWISRWPFLVSGIFLGGLMYIYLSGVFAPPLYAAFFITQWLVVKLAHKFKGSPIPAKAYLTSQFWNLAVTALTATLLLLPIAYILLTRPELEPGTTRVSQAFFLNPQISQGHPWSLLWRSFIGNFGAYGVSLAWLTGQTPSMVLPTSIGLFVFLGFVISIWRGFQGKAPYLFILLWYAMMLLPSILSPDAIPHNLRTIGATTPTYTFVAIFIVWLFEMMWQAGVRWLQPRLGQRNFTPLATGAGLVLAAVLGWIFWQANAPVLYSYFYIFPHTNDAKAAYHVYAVEMAQEINRETQPNVVFILPRNTAAGDVFRNFTTDFLTELEQPPAAHDWIIDNEETLAADLTRAVANHDIVRLVRWKTSKHTGADPKRIIPYYLEKYGHYDHTDTFEYFDIDTYILETSNPDIQAGEQLEPVNVDFGEQLRLTGYALGDAEDAAYVTEAQAAANGLLWLHLAWQKIDDHPENLKVSALIYNQEGQLVTQIDKLLLNNILQTGSAKWELGTVAHTYFLIPIPPATPPGTYPINLAVYSEDSLARLPLTNPASLQERTDLFKLTEFTVVPARNQISPDELDLALPIGQELRPGLTLIGFETLPGGTIRPGDQVGASVIWQAGEAPPAMDWEMSLSVKAGQGDEEWVLSEPVGLAGPDYPTSHWQPNELLRGWLTGRIPSSFEPGLYKLRLRLTAKNQPEIDPLILPVGDFQVEGWTRIFDPPQPQTAIGADFADYTTLVGLDNDTAQISPGDRVLIRLYWQAQAEFEQNYTAFIHLIGPDGLLYGQVDQVPGAGDFPTTGWLPGEYITDEYTVPVDPAAPSGDYQIEIGMYDPETGQRLPLTELTCQTDSCQKSADSVLWSGLRVR